MYESVKRTAVASLVALSLSAVAASSPALAFGGHTWRSGHGGWHGGRGGAAVGAGIGFAAGALAGAALASPYYGYYDGGYCDPYYGCGYGPSYSPGYYYGGFGPQYPLAPNYPYYSTGGNSGGANFPP
jgi:hypothetical protein